MLDALGFSAPALIGLSALCFLAGLVRGFTGFALSALIVASVAVFIPPIELLPMLLCLEIGAGLMMVRGGTRDGNRLTVLLLILGTWIGLPVGLWLTTTLPIAHSKMTALCIVLVLAALQLARLRMPWLATRPGTMIAGCVAGTVSGLAQVGGMVVALYVLAHGASARSMRGTLVLYLFFSSLGGLFYQVGFGVMNTTGALRGLFLLPLTLAGVWLGARLFVPRWEVYYRPLCLMLLICLAITGLLQLLL